MGKTIPRVITRKPWAPAAHSRHRPERRDSGTPASGDTSRTNSTCREMSCLMNIFCTCHRIVLSLRPVAAAISRGVLPSASITATWLSAGVRSRAAITSSGSIRTRLAGSTISTSAATCRGRKSMCPPPTGLTCKTSRGKTDRRVTDIEALVPWPPQRGRARANRFCRIVVVGRRAGMEEAAPVAQPVALAQEVTGRIVNGHDMTPLGPVGLCRTCCCRAAWQGTCLRPRHLPAPGGHARIGGCGAEDA